MINRETVRDALNAALTADLVTSKAVVQAVVGNLVTDPAGQSPIVAILSAGSERPRMTFAGSRTIFAFQIQTWVRVTGSSWTAANAEDRLDLIERYIAEYIEANQTATNWNAIEYAQASVVEDIVIGGEPYLVETIFIRVFKHG